MTSFLVLESSQRACITSQSSPPCNDYPKYTDSGDSGFFLSHSMLSRASFRPPIILSIPVMTMGNIFPLCPATGRNHLSEGAQGFYTYTAKRHVVIGASRPDQGKSTDLEHDLTESICRPRNYLVESNVSGECYNGNEGGEGKAAGLYSSMRSTEYGESSLAEAHVAGSNPAVPTYSHTSPAGPCVSSLTTGLRGPANFDDGVKV